MRCVTAPGVLARMDGTKVGGGAIGTRPMGAGAGGGRKSGAKAGGAGAAGAGAGAALCHAGGKPIVYPGGGVVARMVSAVGRATPTAPVAVPWGGTSGLVLAPTPAFASPGRSGN